MRRPLAREERDLLNARFFLLALRARPGSSTFRHLQREKTLDQREKSRGELEMPLYQEEKSLDLLKMPLYQEEKSLNLLKMPLYQEEKSLDLLKMPLYQEERSLDLLNMPLYQEERSRDLLNMPLYQEERSRDLLNMPLYQEEKSLDLLKMPLYQEERSRRRAAPVLLHSGAARSRAKRPNGPRFPSARASVVGARQLVPFRRQLAGAEPNFTLSLSVPRRERGSLRRQRVARRVVRERPSA